MLIVELGIKPVRSLYADPDRTEREIAEKIVQLLQNPRYGATPPPFAPTH